MRPVALAALPTVQPPPLFLSALGGLRVALVALAAMVQRVRPAARPVACQPPRAWLLAVLQAQAAVVAVAVTARKARGALVALEAQQRAQLALLPLATVVAVVAAVQAAQRPATAATVRLDTS